MIVHSDILCFPIKLIICFENEICPSKKCAEEVYYLLRKYNFLFGNMISSKKVKSLFRKHCLFVRKILLLPRKFIICFGNMIFMFENVTFSKTCNHLLRKYDFSFGNRSCSKKVNYLLRKYNFPFENKPFRRKLIICFGSMICSFENIIFIQLASQPATPKRLPSYTNAKNDFSPKAKFMLDSERRALAKSYKSR